MGVVVPFEASEASEGLKPLIGIVSDDMQAVNASLTVGDEVMTSSGLYGRIVALDDSIATLEVAPGVNVRYDRRAVTRPPATPSGPASTAPDAEN